MKTLVETLGEDPGEDLGEDRGNRNVAPETFAPYYGRPLSDQLNPLPEDVHHYTRHTDTWSTVMTLKRHYFYSDDIDDLEHVESELIDRGIEAPQIHVLSRDNASVHRHEKLNGVSSLMKRDMFRSGLTGAIVGVGLGMSVLIVSALAGWMQSSAGVMPFLFLALALFGASTWIGGLYGFQKPNRHFQRFQSALDDGRHVLFVDLDDAGRKALYEVCAAHSRLESAGTGDAAPEWAVELSNRTSTWWYWRMWKNA